MAALPLRPDESDPPDPLESAVELEPLDPLTCWPTVRATEATVPAVVTYHPAYLLRNLADKAKSWDDLCLALDAYRAVSAG